MNFEQEMLDKVDAEIERLQGIRTMLVGGQNAVPRARVSVRGVSRRATQQTRGVRRPMSAEGRRKRSEAQRARWARVKGIQAQPTPQNVQTPVKQSTAQSKPHTELDSPKASTPNASAPVKAVS